MTQGKKLIQNVVRYLLPMYVTTGDQQLPLPAFNTLPNTVSSRSDAGLIKGCDYGLI